MTVHDTVDADQIEVGDTISWNDDEIEVTEILASDTPDVLFKGYSLIHGSVLTYDLPFNQRVDILGA
jgi:hypothetical protein